MDPSKHPVVMTEPPVNAAANRERMVWRRHWNAHPEDTISSDTEHLLDGVVTVEMPVAGTAEPNRHASELVQLRFEVTYALPAF